MKEKLPELRMLLQKLSQRQIIRALEEIKKVESDEEIRGNIVSTLIDRASRSLKDL